MEQEKVINNIKEKINFVMFKSIKTCIFLTDNVL
jgi:hypothetical protein